MTTVNLNANELNSSDPVLTMKQGSANESLAASGNSADVKPESRIRVKKNGQYLGTLLG